MIVTKRWPMRLTILPTLRTLTFDISSESVLEGVIFFGSVLLELSSADHRGILRESTNIECSLESYHT